MCGGRESAGMWRRRRRTGGDEESVWKEWRSVRCEGERKATVGMEGHWEEGVGGKGIVECDVRV